MANPEHVEIVQQGAEAVADWRAREPRGQLDLSEADLTQASLCGADLSGARLGFANLSEMDPAALANVRSRLPGAILNGAILVDADLIEANLTRAKLVEANLRNADLPEAHLRHADLSSAHLEGARLMEADLRVAKLNGAHLSGANLERAHLSDADLSGATLQDANFSDANLTQADLTDADLSGADLTRTNLTDADLSGANLRDTVLRRTVFGGTILSDAKGLEECNFRGPCLIDQTTIEISGPLPQTFLRGCGLPDEVIDALRSLDHQYYSCFISYSHKDDEFAHRLHADLQNNGVRCWFAPEDIKIGDPVRSTIEEAIQKRDKLLLVLSETSIESDWVEHEVDKALEEEECRNRTVLFPLRLDDAVMSTKFGWAKRIREAHKPTGRHIGDFTSWKNHDAYAKSFERLLKDLKAKSTSKKPGVDGAPLSAG